MFEKTQLFICFRLGLDGNQPIDTKVIWETRIEVVNLGQF